ncbi:MAG: NADPH:quinone oxidoreductase family protein [Alphaproteobacteria bacterium]|nr:NADPH:quinone oxidoreductase family protein [Alphaproteobacteria bacterium]
MRAILCTDWGTPDDLKLADVEPPALMPGHVRIAVEASAVNFADTLLIAGTYQERPDRPFSPGLELAGTVAEIGAGVAAVAPGDRVMAVVPYGAFAEQVMAPEENVFRIPDAMDFDTAAAFPVAYGTSHVALTVRVPIRAGETLLVHGASGGVGLTAVEIGKILGATVIATASSPEKLEIAKSAGADHLIDYSRDDVVERVKAITGGRGAEIHFDPVGGDAFSASMRCVAWGGKILIIGFASGKVPKIPANILLVKEIAVFGFYWGAYRIHAPEIVRDSFAELLGWFGAGRLHPHISHRFPLERTTNALKTVLARKSSGKVVITI